MSSPLVVRAQELRRSYPEPDRRGRRAVLDGLDLELAAGEALLISGSSGCGKTTLLSILGCLERAEGGRLELFGHDVAPLSASERTSLRRGRISFCFQSPQLLPALSARENALIPLLPRGLVWSPVARRVDELMERLGIAPLANARAERLSGGEQQRVALVRALAPQPELLLLDEPAAHLDEQTRATLGELLREAQAEGAALILSSHEGFGRDWVQRHLELRGGELRPAAEVPL